MASNTNCCEDDVVGGYLGEGSKKTLTKKRIIAAFAMPKYNNSNQLNTLDLTQADFGTYLKDKIQTTTASGERIYPWGEFEKYTASRGDFGNYTSPTGTKQVFKSVGGVYSVQVDYEGSKASFVKMTQLDSFDCGEFTIAEIDEDLTIWVYKSDTSSTTAAGYPINGDSMENYFTYADESNPNKVIAMFDYKRTMDMKCSYGIPSCDHGLSLDDFAALHPGDLTVVDATATASIEVGAFMSLGRAKDNTFFTGVPANGFTVTDTETGTIVASVATEDAANEKYTLALTPSLTTAGKFKVELNSVTGYGFSSVKG